MENPFQYGGRVKEDAFCNRRKEISDVVRAMENGEKLFVYSERRIGKTSLALLALDKLPSKEYIKIYVDCWATDNEINFITNLSKSITEATGNTADKLLKTAATFFNRFTSNVTVDDEGKPVIAFGINKAVNVNQELEDVLNVPVKIGKKEKKKVIIIFDEFQQILEYKSDLTERKLRSVIQHHQGVSYLFLGSRKHLIKKMFLDKSRPLYRSAGHYPLHPIDSKDWLPFIQKKFNLAGKAITQGQINSICRLSEGHPFYTQHLCHVLWDLCTEDIKVTEELINSSVKILLERESYAYATLWDSLSGNQKKILRGMANEERGIRPFASDFLVKYNIGSASAAQRSVKHLLEMDIIDRDNGSFVIVDRFLKIWIRNTLSI